jgi:hypothetical protein
MTLGLTRSVCCNVDKQNRSVQKSVAHRMPLPKYDRERHAGSDSNHRNSAVCLRSCFALFGKKMMSGSSLKAPCIGQSHAQVQVEEGVADENLAVLNAFYSVWGAKMCTARRGGPAWTTL